MKNDYKVLKTLAVIFKILAIIGFVGVSFITIANFAVQGNTDPMMQEPFPFSLFNRCFPIFFGLFQTVLLYSFGEMILLFIDIKKDLSRITEKI